MLGDTGCDTFSATLNSCEDSNADCAIGRKCVCKTGYFDDNGADTRLGICRQSKLDKRPSNLDEMVAMAVCLEALTFNHSISHCCICADSYPIGIIIMSPLSHVLLTDSKVFPSKSFHYLTRVKILRGRNTKIK